MVEIERGVHLLCQAAVRIVGDPHVLLFEHDIQLGTHDRVGEHQPGDAIGLERHHLLEVLARDPLEEPGIVAGGERIFLTADGSDFLREAIAGVLCRALEHQMLEEMREAGFARRLIGAADLVPDHVGNDRRAMVRHDDDFKTVAEGEIRNLRLRAGARDACSADERDQENERLRHELSLPKLDRKPAIRNGKVRRARSVCRLALATTSGKDAPRPAGASAGRRYFPV